MPEMGVEAAQQAGVVLDRLVLVPEPGRRWLSAVAALAARMGYRSKSSITKLEKGINDLPRAKLEELAAALDTTPAWLMGLADLPCPPPGFEPLPEMARVPLVGSIACGTPITAEQNIECYIGVPAAWHADFALTCHGKAVADQDHAINTGFCHRAKLVDLLRQSTRGVSRRHDRYASGDTLKHETDKLQRFSIR